MGDPAGAKQHRGSLHRPWKDMYWGATVLLLYFLKVAQIKKPSIQEYGLVY